MAVEIAALFGGTKLPLNCRSGFQVPSSLEIGCGLHFAMIRRAVVICGCRTLSPSAALSAAWVECPALAWLRLGGFVVQCWRASSWCRSRSPCEIGCSSKVYSIAWVRKAGMNSLDRTFSLSRSCICSRALTIATAWHSSVGHETVNFHFSPSRRKHRGKKISVISVN